MAEVYAGYSSYTDHEIGRLIDYLETDRRARQHADRRDRPTTAPRARAAPNGSVNENKFFNSVMDDIDENLKYLDVLGSPETYNHYSTGWAFAFNTPCKMFKRHTWEGGVADPMVVHWPTGIKAAGEIRDQYTHCSDIVPTVYDCLGRRAARDGQGLHAVAARRHELQVQLRRRRRGDAEAESVLRHARHSRDLA